MCFINKYIRERTYIYFLLVFRRRVNNLHRRYHHITFGNKIVKFIRRVKRLIYYTNYRIQSPCSDNTELGVFQHSKCFELTKHLVPKCRRGYCDQQPLALTCNHSRKHCLCLSCSGR